jgi:hypothetical protein
MGTVPLTGAGIADLYFYGRHSQFSPKHKKIIEAGIKFILDNKEQISSYNWWSMYAIFYPTLAMWWAGEKHWQQWYKYVVDIIKKSQQQDGKIEGTYGMVDTAFAVLTLLIPKKLLPLFDK